MNYFSKGENFIVAFSITAVVFCCFFIPSWPHNSQVQHLHDFCSSSYVTC